MAHKGRPYEFMRFRDLWFTDIPQRQVGKRFAYNLAGLLTDPFTPAQSTPWISYAGVADYDAGSITWTWPPGGLQLFPFEMSLHMEVTQQVNPMRIWFKIWNDTQERTSVIRTWPPHSGEYAPMGAGDNPFLSWNTGTYIQGLVVVGAAVFPSSFRAAAYALEPYFPDP